jgi:hypothetical protein
MTTALIILAQLSGVLVYAMVAAAAMGAAEVAEERYGLCERQAAMLGWACLLWPLSLVILLFWLPVYLCYLAGRRYG